jgi:hypothetical protein
MMMIYFLKLVFLPVNKFESVPRLSFDALSANYIPQSNNIPNKHQDEIAVVVHFLADWD